MSQLNLTAFPFGPSTVIKAFPIFGLKRSATVKHVLLAVIASDVFKKPPLYPPVIKIVL